MFSVHIINYSWKKILQDVDVCLQCKFFMLCNLSSVIYDIDICSKFCITVIKNEIFTFLSLGTGNCD